MRPERIERPGEVFQRIAQMRHFPIEDGTNITGCVVKEIAAAIVTVDNGNLLRRRRRMALQPADRRARNGLRLAFVLVDDVLPARKLMAPAMFD